MVEHEQPDGWRQWVRNNSPRNEATTEPAASSFTPAPASPQPFSAGMHLQPPFDPVELLPERAQDRLRKLRQRRTDAHALIPPFEDVRAASMAKIEAQNALKRLTAIRRISALTSNLMIVASSKRNGRSTRRPPTSSGCKSCRR